MRACRCWIGFWSLSCAVSHSHNLCAVQRKSGIYADEFHRRGVENFCLCGVWIFSERNFAKTEDYLLSKAYGKQLPTTYKSSDKTANRAVRIGFSDLSQENGEDVQTGVALPAKVNFGSSLQIHIVAVVGLVCFIILIVVRNVEPAGENIAALTQLRDMLSSSVGFLAGSKRSS